MVARSLKAPLSTISLALILSLCLSKLTTVHCEFGVNCAHLIEELRVKVLEPVLQKCETTPATSELLAESREELCEKVSKMGSSAEKLLFLADKLGLVRSTLNFDTVKGLERYRRIPVGGIPKKLEEDAKKFDNNIEQIQHVMQTLFKREEEPELQEKLDALDRHIQSNVLAKGKEALISYTEEIIDSLLVEKASPVLSSVAGLEKPFGALLANSFLNDPDFLKNTCEKLAWSSRQLVVSQIVVSLQFPELRPTREQWDEWKNSEHKCLRYQEETVKATEDLSLAAVAGPQDARKQKSEKAKVDYAGLAKRLEKFEEDPLAMIGHICQSRSLGGYLSIEMQRALCDNEFEIEQHVGTVKKCFTKDDHYQEVYHKPIKTPQNRLSVDQLEAMLAEAMAKIGKAVRSYLAKLLELVERELENDLSHNEFMRNKGATRQWSASGLRWNMREQLKGIVETQLRMLKRSATDPAYVLPKNCAYLCLAALHAMDALMISKYPVRVSFNNERVPWDQTMFSVSIWVNAAITKHPKLTEAAREADKWITL